MKNLFLFILFSSLAIFNCEAFYGIENPDGFDKKKHGDTTVFKEAIVKFRRDKICVISCPFTRGCPSGLTQIKILAKVVVVDTSDKVIPNTKVFQFYTDQDSVELPKRVEIKSDSTSIVFRVYHQPTGLSKHLLIQAKGYADVYINNIEYGAGILTLKVRMSPITYLQKEDVLIRMEKYVVDTLLIADHERKIGLAEFTKGITGSEYVQENIRRQNALISTYPNPVRDRLVVKFSSGIPFAHKAVISDLSGKTLMELELTESVNTINTEELIPGIYFVSVYDENLTLKHQMKLIKL